MASQKTVGEGVQTKKGEKKSPRRGIQNPFVYGGTIVILIITIVAFVFIPSMGGGLSSSGSAPNFGSWNGKPITYSANSYFANQVAQINEYLRQQGLSDQNYQLYAYQVWSMAFQNSALRAALIDTTARSGFTVTEKGIDEAIAKNETFFVDGVFSIEKYNATAFATRLALRASTAEDLKVQRYYEDLYTIAPSSGEIAFIGSMVKPQRSILYASIPLSAYPQSEITAWAKEHSSLFRSLALSRITITSSEADAKKVLKQVRDNQLSFEDAAKSHSQDDYANKGGDAGTVYFHVFSADFAAEADAEKVATLNPGDISEVYKLGEKTWAFFRLNAKTAEPDFSSASLIEEARSYLYASERGTLESWAIASAQKLSAATDRKAFQTAAKAAGLETKEAGPFIINVGSPSFYAYNQQIPLLQAPAQNTDATLVSAEGDEAFMTEMFSLKVGQVSKPLVVGDSVVVFSVNSDADGTEDDAVMVNFAYPYFQQQAVESAARNSMLASKKFKDNFSTTFFKLFSTGQTSSAGTSGTDASTTTTAAPAN